MKANSWLVASWVLLLLAGGLLAGCGSIDIRVPENISIGGGKYLDAADDIEPARPGDATDAERENRQLRQRIAQLNQQLKDAQGKLHKTEKRVEDLQGENRKLREEKDKLKRQRDDYKTRLDRYMDD
ncbi:MAG: hypothetical protein HQ546_11220 [Planctomycetes bacterium]|nr:hypothetical protein [Planctomycetota bacterium]